MEGLYIICGFLVFYTGSASYYIMKRMKRTEPVPIVTIRNFLNDNITEVNPLAEEACCICLLDYTTIPKLEIVKLPCGHIYHYQCIYMWLNRKAICPVCRTKF